MDPPKQHAPFQPEDSARRGIGRAAAEQDLKRSTSPSQSEGLAQSANSFCLAYVSERTKAAEKIGLYQGTTSQLAEKASAKGLAELR
jgi:hypothetical protein